MQSRPWLAVPALVFVAGCYDAPQAPLGGEPRFDAAPSATALDGGRDTGTGSTWAALYESFFGPRGVASCAGDGHCHGAAEQEGAQVSRGYVCPPDRDGCYRGITNPTTKLVVPGDMTTPPEQTGLHIVLRKTSGGGIMPKRPEFAFTPEDMARIHEWIRRGAPND